MPLFAAFWYCGGNTGVPRLSGILHICTAEGWLGPEKQRGGREGNKKDSESVERQGDRQTEVERARERERERERESERERKRERKCVTVAGAEDRETERNAGEARTQRMLHGQLLRTQGQLFHLQTITVRLKRIGNEMINQKCM